MLPTPMLRLPSCLAVASALVLLLVGLSPIASRAQVETLDVRFGVKAGVNGANMSGDYLTIVGDRSDLYETTTQRRARFALGGYAIIGFGQPVFLQTELLYVQKGTEVNVRGLAAGTITLNSTYLEIPILARFEIPVDENVAGPSVLPYLFGGPTVGVKISADTDIEGPFREIRPFEELASTTEFGLSLGAGVEYGLDAGTVTLEARYQRGLTNVVSLDGRTAQHRGILITVGILF
jgi:hypothetical protein